MEEQRPDVPFAHRTREGCGALGMFYCDRSTPFDSSRHVAPEAGIHHAELERVPNPTNPAPDRVHLKCRNCGMSQYIPKALADLLGL